MDRRLNNVLIILILLSATTISAQNPNNDKSWILNSSKSDEFKENVIDKNKWKRNPDWGTCDVHGGVIFSKFDVNGSYKLENGILTLYAKEENCQCRHYTNNSPNGKYNDHITNYLQGALISKTMYAYGYFEIRCKLPVDGCAGVNPCFWLYSGNKQNEIDIAEFNGRKNEHTCNMHYQNEFMSDAWVLRTDKEPYYDFQVDFNSFHTFACEWTPNYVNFYYDDKLVRSTNNEYCKQLKPMLIYITIETLDGKFSDSLNNVSQNANFTYPFQIDYVRYYTPKMDCNKVVNQSNFNFNTFDYAVKKSITLKNTTVPQNSKYTLRATDYMELQGVFEVPLGSELTLMPTPKY